MSDFTMFIHPYIRIFIVSLANASMIYFIAKYVNKIIKKAKFKYHSIICTILGSLLLAFIMIITIQIEMQWIIER